MALVVVVIAAGALGGTWGLAYLGATVAQNISKYFLLQGEIETEKIDRSKLRYVRRFADR